MSKRDDGGPACTRNKCGTPAVRRQGHQWLCHKHYRFTQMRVLAKRRGKAVPSHEQLEALVHPEMRCADCNVVMSWSGREEPIFVATLQHYRDGSFGLVCRSCNTRHAFTPDDDYRDMPKDHKFCPRCQTIKPESEFWADKSRPGARKIKSWCRVCSTVAYTEWQENNRDKYNAKQRAYRARRKAEGRPVPGGPH